MWTKFLRLFFPCLVKEPERARDNKAAVELETIKVLRPSTKHGKVAKHLPKREAVRRRPRSAADHRRKNE